MAVHWKKRIAEAIKSPRNDILKNNLNVCHYEVFYTEVIRNIRKRTDSHTTVSAAASVGASALQRCPPDTRTAVRNDKLKQVLIVCHCE